ncbi:hypothetical protein CH275_05210 [Rhodococcus sp. 06-235-1A]|uniref:glycosyltransferase family 4 protein n=1 Tax=Rhodococcus sp. 06-235-1A TaxID=2022508 RepID=UPI000B9BF16F|nr:glycosyltransferase family 4 protein [Rhodococcus sp. 06-235-1A]OZD07970.1 hypothetical protein CH275_05210 [Rhodococcus sp. 06-235-1A]
MKIVHVMGQLNPSGMERMFVSSQKYMQAVGVESMIVCQGLLHPYRDAISESGIPVRTVPAISSVKGMFAFIRILRDERPNIVHVHTEGAYLQVVFSVVLWRRKAKVVRTVHNVFRHAGFAFHLRRLKIAVTKPFVSQTISPSSDVQQNEVRFGRHSLLVENWVDDKFYELGKGRAHQPTSGSPMFLIVGNCSETKNHDYVVETLYSLNCTLAHHGNEDGATNRERSNLQAMQCHGLLRSRGTSDPYTSLKECNVFVMPSLAEGMSVALLEAIASGLYILVNDVEGLRWAAGIPGVVLIDSNLAAWRSALVEVASMNIPSGFAREPRFSAARGAQELVEVYRTVLNDADQ